MGRGDERYNLDPNIVADIMAHAFTYIRFFSAHGVYNPRDIYETELRKLFDYKTEALARRLKKAVGGKYRVRYRKTAAAGEELVELPD